MALFMALAHTQRRRELYPLVLILVFSAVLSGDLSANLWDKIKSTVDKDDQQEQTLKKYFPCGVLRLGIDVGTGRRHTNGNTKGLERITSLSKLRF